VYKQLVKYGIVDELNWLQGLRKGWFLL